MMKPNRLIHEKSPYLLQHAYNPVDWYPWGEEAFARAKELCRPIFLSIGYATCHWCHIIEKESFEDQNIAKRMNRFFISIKVDREELPEIDRLYMEFAQGMISGPAGWPLNLILTPELQPFFAFTYCPPKTTEHAIGLIDLIDKIQQIWEGPDRAQIFVDMKRIVAMFAKSIRTNCDLKMDRDTNASRCLEQLIDTASSAGIDVCGQDGSVVMLKPLSQPAWSKQKLSCV